MSSARLYYLGRSWPRAPPVQWRLGGRGYREGGPPAAPLGGRKRGPDDPCITLRVHYSKADSQACWESYKDCTTFARPFPCSALLCAKEKNEQSLRRNRRTVSKIDHDVLSGSPIEAPVRTERLRSKTENGFQKALRIRPGFSAAADCGMNTPWQRGLDKTGLSLHACCHPRKRTYTSRPSHEVSVSSRIH